MGLMRRKIDLTKMGVECDYSFEMLYKAAFGKSISKKEKSRLQILDQENINLLVKEWAQKAGWNTKIKFGQDGKEYLSFYPTNIGTPS